MAVATERALRAPLVVASTLPNGHYVAPVIATRTWTTHAINVSVGALVGVLAVAWAWAPSLFALATDGIPADEYEGYNNAGYVMLALLLMVLLPVASWAVYLFTLRPGRPVWTALAFSQIPCVVIAAVAITRLSA